MVLLLRLIAAFLGSALLRPRIGPLDQGVLRMRVWPNDLDLNMHVNSGRFLSFMDVGRVDLLVRMRVFRKVIRRGWRPINAGTTITFRKSLLLGERFTIRSRIVCWDEKWLYFEHIIENAKGELAAMAHTRGLLRGKEGNVKPDELLAFMGFPGLASPPMPPAIEQWR
jgi:acyl-CoA thioesterase FadM